jgi:hypothetical protein
MNSSLKVLVVPGRAVMSEQGVQDGTKYTPLRGPRVEDQLGRCVVTYPYNLGVACQGTVVIVTTLHFYDHLYIYNELKLN